MNQYYNFIGHNINAHLQHHQNNNNFRGVPLVYCPYYYPLPKYFTLAFYVFRLWTESIGVVAINSITINTFDELTGINFGESHPTRIRQRIIQLLNTFVFHYSPT